MPFVRGMRASSTLFRFSEGLCCSVLALMLCRSAPDCEKHPETEEFMENARIIMELSILRSSSLRIVGSRDNRSHYHLLHVHHRHQHSPGNPSSYCHADHHQRLCHRFVVDHCRSREALSDVHGVREHGQDKYGGDTCRLSSSSSSSSSSSPLQNLKKEH